MRSAMCSFRYFTHFEAVVLTTSFAMQALLPWNVGKHVTVPSGRAGNFLSSFLRWLSGRTYLIPPRLSRTLSPVVSFLDQYPTNRDLTAFLTFFRYEEKAATFRRRAVEHGLPDLHKHRSSSTTAMVMRCGRPSEGSSMEMCPSTDSNV